jgi:DNA end-binding protein Ku
MLVLETMHWPEELRDANFAELKKRPKVQDRERKMARQLIKQLSDDFDPSQFKDEYHKALKKIINKKIKGEEIVVPERAEEPDTVVDLMEALKASVAAAKRGERPKPAVPKKKKTSKSSGNGKASDEDLSALSKKNLDERAKELGIPGRSKMDKKALVRALKKSA